MGLRTTTRLYLVADLALTAMVPASRWITRGAVEDTPELPYVVLAWGGTAPSTGGRNTPQLLDVYVHNEIGDYTFIDDVLELVYQRLSSVQQYVASGYRLVQADFQGKSADLTDPDTRTGFIYSSWKLLGGGI